MEETAAVKPIPSCTTAVFVRARVGSVARGFLPCELEYLEGRNEGSRRVSRHKNVVI